MSTYLTLKKYKALSTLPDSFIDDVEERYEGWITQQLEAKARWIDARLRKRYAVPFAAHDADPATPVTVQDWLTRLVNLAVWFKRGVDPGDAQFEEIRTDRDEAKSEILEAANSNEGWFDLPLRDDEDPSAIARGTPKGYSEQSPYVWTDQQLEAAMNEDSAGSGS